MGTDVDRKETEARKLWGMSQSFEKDGIYKICQIIGYIGYFVMQYAIKHITFVMLNQYT